MYQGLQNHHGEFIYTPKSPEEFFWDNLKIWWKKSPQRSPPPSKIGNMIVSYSSHAKISITSRIEKKILARTLRRAFSMCSTFAIISEHFPFFFLVNLKKRVSVVMSLVVAGRKNPPVDKSEDGWRSWRNPEVCLLFPTGRLNKKEKCFLNLIS